MNYCKTTHTGNPINIALDNPKERSWKQSEDPIL